MLKDILKEHIEKYLYEDRAVSHPYHAHVTTYQDGNDEKELVTGHGHSKQQSKSASFMTHRIWQHGSGAKHYEGYGVDRDDDDDVEAHESSKSDTHFKATEKAHNHLKSISDDLHSGRGRDGYEMSGDDVDKHLHFDWKKKTITHKSEMK